jgi:hypothetical protein
MGGIPLFEGLFGPLRAGETERDRARPGDSRISSEKIGIDARKICTFSDSAAFCRFLANPEDHSSDPNKVNILAYGHDICL